MRLTPEQKDAFRRADSACGLIKRGRNQWAVLHPWGDIGGPSTETAASWPYIAAKQRRTEYVAFYALRALGYDTQTAEWAVGEYPEGRALDVFKAALAKAGEP